MKDGCLHMLTLTECTHQATQYKKLIDALQVLWAEMRFRFVADVICTDRELVKASFLSEILWLTAMNIQVDTVDPNAPENAASARPVITQMVLKIYVFDAIMHEKLLLENGLKSKIKSQE